MDFFEDINEGEGYYHKPDKSFFIIDALSSDEEYLKWLNGELNYLKEANHDRLRQVEKNMSLYKGIQYQMQEVRQSIRDRNEDKSRAVQKVVEPLIQDIVDTRVAKLVKYKPAVSILPTNDEQADKIAAKMTKYMLDNIWYNERFDGVKIPRFARTSEIAGEAYFFVLWNPEKGDVNPAFKEAQKEADKVPVIDQNGNQKLDKLGNPVFIEHEVRNGDVDYIIESPINVLTEKIPSGAFELVNYLFRREYLPADVARQRYPEKAHLIKEGSEAKIYDFERLRTQSMRKYVEIWHFYHKKTRELPKGKHMVFVKEGVLHGEDFPFNHDKLPCVPLTCLLMEGEQHGRSVIEFAAPLTGAYNNLTNMTLRNQVLVAHPKWMMPAGAADIKSLGNDITIVQYKGPTPPQLIQANPTGAEIFNFRQQLKEAALAYSKVNSTMRGEPPKGITAAVALQYLSELENERWNEQILKLNEAILQIAQMTLAVIGDYYDDSDGRIVRVIGKDNKYMSIFFDVTSLNKSYDVRIQSSSALPESKAARTEYLLYLNERFPNQVTPESVLNMLELSQSDKFLDQATVSVRAAEAENELMSDGKDVQDPSSFEDHITHWKNHSRMVMEWNFKNMTDKVIQDRILTHIQTHEYLMIEKGKQNAAFAQQLLALPEFPLVFKIMGTLEQTLMPTPPPVPPVSQGMPYNSPIQGGAIAPTPGLDVQAPGQQANITQPSVETAMSQEPAVSLQPSVQPTSAI